MWSRSLCGLFLQRSGRLPIVQHPANDEKVAVEGESDAQSLPPGIAFQPASAADQTAVAQVQADLRRRTLRAFAGLGLIRPDCGRGASF